MLKFTSIVGYTSCGPTYIESFLTIFGQCINVLTYDVGYPSGVKRITNKLFVYHTRCDNRSRNIRKSFPNFGKDFRT